MKNVDSFQIETLIETIFNSNLEEFNISSQIPDLGVNTNDYKAYLWNKFNLNNSGVLGPKEFESIFLEIYTDKLYFEKIWVEVSRKVFMMNYNEFMIKNAHAWFLQNLYNAGLDFYNGDPCLQTIAQFKQNFPNFGFRKYDNGH